jgi:F0F1-type ATP synthase membrane subunit b/b'
MLFLKQYYQEIITALIVASALLYLVKKFVFDKLLKTKNDANTCDNCK